MPFSNHDVVPDSPINNFATWNPLRGGAAPSNGNLTINNAVIYWSNLPLQENTYVEFYVTAGTTSTSAQFGVSTFDHAPANRRIWGGNGQFYNGSWGGGLTSYTTGDVIALHINSSNQVVFYKNGSLINSYSLPNNDVYLEARRVSSSAFGTVNFGQDHTFGGAKTGGAGATDANGLGQFYYQPPAGALALCTQNIPSGPIDIANDDVPSDYFKAVTYIGNGSTQSIDVGFQPHFVWLKERSSTSFHQLLDVVRGAGKRLESNSTGAEVTPSPVGLSSFDTDGFTVENNNGYNQSSQTYVAWCWKAAGSPADNQARIIDTDGSLITKSTADLKNETSASITPSKVSANRKSGFSIVKYAGTGSVATVPHGLGKVPNLILIKRTSGASNWAVGGSILGSSSTLYLNLTNKLETYTNSLIENIQTSTKFQLGTDTNRNELNGAHIAYCWHSVAGYSKFGSYVGNGSADGPFVELGFRPAWVMVKRTDSTGAWIIKGLSEVNPLTSHLNASTSAAEYTTNILEFDFLSNGYKIRNTNAGSNANNGTYIFMAFAEQPFNAPSNAR